MKQSTFKLQQLCELSRHQAGDGRLSLTLKEKILGYNNNDNYTTKLAESERTKWLDEMKHERNKRMLTAQQEEYLEDLMHPQLVYTRPKKPIYQKVRQPYGRDNFMLKAYQDSFTSNIRNNVVSFRLLEQSETKLVEQLRETTNFVKEFFEKFGHILQKQSPEYWQLNLFDILKLVSNTKKSDAELRLQLPINIPDEQGVKYLITFRKEICMFLEATDYFKTSENTKQEGKDILDSIGVNNSNLAVSRRKNKEKPKEHLSRFLLTQELAEVDFLKMKDNDLALKIPTLKRRDDDPEYVYFRIQPMPKVDHKVQLISVSESIPQQYRDCFESDRLNVIQSKVFQHAYNSSENMLVCAPTGAGKTNIATLTILNVIKRFNAGFKVIYISPMKALANELVQKFTKKFKEFKTREMTGDIQLSQKELASTHIIVTTPEKLDVVTRKNSLLMEEVKLVIFDEVHLLNDERGWVLESLVARLFRSVFRTQKTIRIVGLSATLPNYGDVATFLKVGENGLFHFDSTFRPVPLMIHFYGIKSPSDQGGGGRKRRQLDVLNEKCYQFCMRHVKTKKQVLVFCHSRKETVKYCKFIMERSKEIGDEMYFGQVDKLLQKYKVTDRQLQKVMPFAVAFHHAGMVRADRNLVEKMFMNGDVKILVATATLAWGVNLPAYAVVIKGTDVYDVNMSESKDLSILDVQQMFGRAGRPQFDTNGQAALMTDFKKINKYMGALTSVVPIESKFPEFIKEALNAEICSGTVTNVMEGFEWLKYTFFAIRAYKNPRTYGCPSDENEIQMQLHFDEFMRNKVLQVVQELDRAKLIRFDKINETVSSTELGRITSHFYIKCDTMESFCSALHLTISHENPSSINKKFDYKSDLQLLNILASSKEFENIRVRPQQFDQLKSLLSYWILDEQPDFGLPNRSGMPRNFGNYEEQIIIETPQKVLLLLQGYLKDLRYENFSLTNDTQYIVQQSVRLLRCLFDLCCKKNQAMNVQVILKWCKYIENRMYEDNGPLRQFLKISYSGYNNMRVKKDGFMPKDYYDRMEQENVGVNEALEMGVSDLAAKLGARTSKYIGENVMDWCKKLPRVSVDYKIKPIAQTILKIDVWVMPKWRHDPKWHLKSEVFWVFFDDQEEILHSESFLVEDENVIKQQPVQLSFFIPYRDNTKRKYRLLIRSDRWIMDDENIFTVIDLQELGIEMDTLPFTPLLNLEPLPKTALKNPLFESLYQRFNFFNPIQTQLFFPLYHSDNNILIGAPTGSGKTIMAELALLRLFANKPDQKCVYVAPLKSLAKERLIDWVPRLESLKKSVVELTGDYTPDLETLNKAHVIVTTPEKWDGITRNKDRKYTQNVGLIIFDEIHLLGQDRGAVIEVIVSRMNKESKVRMIGLSTAMANGGDVAEWFGTGQYGFFNFKPSVRPVPIEIHFEGFSEKNYCPRMATMNKPAYNHIKKFSQGKPVLLFVSSRRQTRLTALDLIALSEHETRGASPFIKCNHEELHARIEQVSDEYLKQTLNFGIGMHHAGLNSSDRKICEDLFVNGKIQLLIATSTLAWGVNFPARLVIIKGTEFFDPKTHRYVDFPATDLLQMIGRAGRPQFDNKGVAVVYCQQSKKMFYRRYLNDPFPIESSLLQQIDDHINAEIARGTIGNRQQCIDWFTWSYAFRRILKNPNFYAIEDNRNDTIKQFLIKLVDKSVKTLVDSKCIKASDDEAGTLEPLELGFIASTFYLKHQTVKYFDQKIKEGMSFQKMLQMICHAEQFKETPLRHNEDKFNEELSRIAPYKTRDYSSPQAKTFLLFQMHLFDLPPPIRDYVTDMKLIMDASTRVVLGALDIAKEKKLLDAVLMLIYIEQTIFQGLQCNIPYVSQKLWKKITSNEKNAFPGGLAHIVEEWEDKIVQADFKQFIKKDLDREWTKDKEREIIRVIETIPKVKATVELVGLTEEGTEDKSIAIYEDMDHECVLKVYLEKQNKADNKLVLQKGSKVKQVSWWIVVGDHQNNVLGIKRAILRNRATASIRIQLPTSFASNPTLKVYVMSDSYRGLDQQLSYDLKQYIS